VVASMLNIFVPFTDNISKIIGRETSTNFYAKEKVRVTKFGKS